MSDRKEIRRKLAVVGDSYLGQNYNFVTANGRNLTLNGSVTFLNVLAGQPFDIDIDRCFFVMGGSGTDFILSQLPAIIAYRPDYVVFSSGHNDLNKGLTLEVLKANFTKIITTLIDADIVPVMCLTAPQSTVQGSTHVTIDQARTMIVALNRWKRDYASAHKLPLWDWYTPMVDPVTGGFAAGMTYDLVHPGYKAAYQVARQGLIDLASIIPPPTRALQSRAEDPGNLIADAFFEKDGAKVLSPIGGTGPAGWSIMRYRGGASGGAIISTLVPGTDDLGSWLRLTITGATTGGAQVEEVGINLPVVAGARSYQSGDVLEAWLEVAVEANSPFNSILFSIGDHDGSLLRRQSTNGGHAGGKDETRGPSDAWSGILYCPRLAIEPYSGKGMQHLLVQVIIGWDASRNDFSGTVAIRRPTVRKAT